MTVNTMSRLNRAQAEGSLEDMNSARDQQNEVIDQQKDYIKKARDEGVRQAHEDAEAQREQNTGALIGSIICPIIGTLIGRAIGNATADGNKDAALDAKKKAGIADIMVGKTDDRLKDASDSFSDAAQRTQEAGKFARELRETDNIAII